MLRSISAIEKGAMPDTSRMKTLVLIVAGFIIPISSLLSKRRNKGLQKVTEKNFDEIIGQSDVAILAFASAWCATCDHLERILQEISGEMNRPIPMAKVDIIESPTLARKFDIMSIPTMVCLRNGEPIHQITMTGTISKGKISRLIDQKLGL